MSPREVTIDELAEDVRDLRASIDRLNETISRDYIRKDVYSAQQEKVTGDVASARAISMWALGLVCGLAVAALVTFVAQFGGAA